MFSFVESLLAVLTTLSRVLRPLSDFNLALLDLTNLLGGWLRPVANLLEGALGFLRGFGL
ncbi:MAG: hypothetical protein LBB75_04330 [Oscillospiraceae bacterium]|jgi:hypothetical protein|nr:hypothetical protein [Oscillospiraceae bacterium]